MSTVKLRGSEAVQLGAQFQRTCPQHFRAQNIACFSTTLKPNCIYLAMFFNQSNLAGWLITNFSVV